MNPIWAVGLMTGTVLDGNIDVALLKTDGETVETFGAYTLAPYPQQIRDTLELTLTQARKWNFEGPDPAIFAEAEEALTRAQSAAVKELVESAAARARPSPESTIRHCCAGSARMAKSPCSISAASPMSPIGTAATR